MRLIHTGDLHIGKIVNGFNMIEDQRHILKQILHIIDKNKADGIILAGDIYDKTVPSAEAVNCFDQFLSSLEERQITVFMISGNHDSPERIEYFSNILGKSNIHIYGNFQKEIKVTTCKDEYGYLDFHLMPFIKPIYIRRDYPEIIVETYEDAVKQVLLTALPKADRRNILLAHQFVVNGTVLPEQSDSESISIGGVDHINARIFKDYDYVALGHLHREQQAGSENIRYSGSPIKYSFSEANHQKCVLQIDIADKDSIEVTKHFLEPLRDLREIKGTLKELLSVEFLENQKRDDYLHITLTDEIFIPDAIGALREEYKNLMCLDYERQKRKMVEQDDNGVNPMTKDLMTLFHSLYLKQNGAPLEGRMLAKAESIFQKIARGEEE